MDHSNGARSKPLGNALERRRLPRKREGRGRVHAVHHGRRHQDRGPPLLGGFVDDVHRPKLQGGRVVGVDLGGLNELARDLGFSRSEDHTGLLLALRLAWRQMGAFRATGIATSRISTDLTVTPQSAVFWPITSRRWSSAALRSDSSAESMEEPIISRSEVCATRSIASR